MKKIRGISLILVFCLICSFIPIKEVQASPISKGSYTSVTFKPITFGTDINASFGLFFYKPHAYTFNVTKPGTFSVKLGSESKNVKGELIKIATPGEINDPNNKSLKEIDINGVSGNPDSQTFDMNLDEGNYAFVVSGPSSSRYTLRADFSSSDLPFGQEVTGSISSSNPQDNYTINLATPGSLTVTVGAEMTTTIAELKDSNNKVVNLLVLTGATGNPSTKSFTSDLDKGTYSLSISTKGVISNPSGNYTVKADFKSIETNVKEPNNNIDEAQKIKFGNTINGFLTSENSVDVFKFKIDSERTIGIDFSSYIKSAGIALKDEDQKIVWASIAQGDEDNPGVKNIEKKLSPGTYYLFVDKQLTFTGRYSLTVENLGSWDENLSLDTLIEDELTIQNTVNTYNINLKDSGRLKFNVKTYMPGTILEIKDSNRKSLYKTIANGESTNPVTKDFDVDLHAGTYYLSISAVTPLTTGKYALEAHLSSVDNNEIEPNDTMYDAQKILPSGTNINGLLAENDDADVYKVTVSTKGKLSFDFKSYIDSVIIELKDKEQTSLFKKSLAASYEEPKQDTYDVDLDPGTYYLYVRKDILKHTGEYSFKTRFSSNDTNVIEPNDTMATAQPISLNNKINGYISATNEIDVFKFTLSEPCRLKINLTSNIKSANMEIKDANQNIVLNSSFQGNDTEPGVKDVEKKFNAGTYYVTITKQYTYTGKYSLTIGSPYGWIQNVDSTYSYVDSNGDYVKFCWNFIDGTWYHFDRYGIMQTGWLQNEDTWYYLSPSGGMVTNWYKVGDTWYFFDGSGAMKTGWLQQGDTWYFLNSSGAMATGWQQINGTWYYFYSNGAMACNTTMDGYYLDGSGAWR